MINFPQQSGRLQVLHASGGAICHPSSSSASTFPAAFVGSSPPRLVTVEQQPQQQFQLLGEGGGAAEAEQPQQQSTQSSQQQYRSDDQRSLQESHQQLVGLLAAPPIPACLSRDPQPGPSLASSNPPSWQQQLSTESYESGRSPILALLVCFGEDIIYGLG